MYRGTSERGNYLKRVASHSTKPRANGLIDVPPNAQPLEPNSYLHQFLLLLPHFEKALDDGDKAAANAVFKRMSWLRRRCAPEMNERLRLMYLPARRRLRTLKHRRYKDWYEKRKNPDAW
jgi:hypothetical protein